MKIIAVIITIIIILTACYGIATAENLCENLYRLPAVVIDCVKAEESNFYLISCITDDGMIWTFFDSEDYWMIGDMIDLLILEGTRGETDSEIIGVESIYK